MSYQQPARDPHTRGIKWGVWTIIGLFIGFPVMIALCCWGVVIVGAVNSDQ